MDLVENKGQGIKLLVKRCREEFHRPENTEYYSEEDYKAAERKFVKNCLIGFVSPTAPEVA